MTTGALTWVLDEKLKEGEGVGIPDRWTGIFFMFTKQE